MSAWQLHEYGGINQLKLSSTVPMPVVCRPHDVLVRVHAASVNPVDVLMAGKWLACILWLSFTTDIFWVSFFSVDFLKFMYQW